MRQFKVGQKIKIKKLEELKKYGEIDCDGNLRFYDSECYFIRKDEYKAIKNKYMTITDIHYGIKQKGLQYLGFNAEKEYDGFLTNEMVTTSTSESPFFMTFKDIILRIDNEK